MATVVGKLLINGEDNLTSVSAVDITVNGSTVYCTYINASGNLKVKTTSCSYSNEGVVPVIMSGCSII